MEKSFAFAVSRSEVEISVIALGNVIYIRCSAPIPAVPLSASEIAFH